MFAKRHFIRSTFIFVLVVVLLSVAITAVGAQGVTPCDPAVDYATAAMNAYDAGEFEASLPDFFCATGLEPQNIDLHYSATIAMLRTGRIFSVFRHTAYLDTLAAERYSDMVAEAQAMMMGNLLDEDAAVIMAFANYPILQEDLDRLLAINPQSAIAYAYMASKAAYQDGDLDAAVAAAERAVELAPDKVEVLLYVASIYTNALRDFDRATVLNNQALTIESDSISGITARGDIYQMIEDNEAALADFNHAIELDPYDYTLYNRRGLVLQALEDYEGATADYTYVLSVNPGSWTALNGVIEVGLMTGDSDIRVLAAQSFQNARREILDGDTLTVDTPITLMMTGGRMVRIPVQLMARQEVIVTAVADDPDSLDPMLMAVDPDGGAVAWNDDIDAENTNYSASIIFTPDIGGEYTLLVTHSGAGTEGAMTVTISPTTRK